MIPWIVLGVLVIVAMIGYELRRPEINEWARLQRRRARKAWMDLFEWDGES